MKKIYNQKNNSLYPSTIIKTSLDGIFVVDKDVKNVSLTDLVDLKDLQQIQDAFAVANDVASIISDVNGKPITKASNFCEVCEIIRSTEKGNRNCIKSDKILGEKAKALMKPTYEECLSCGFVDASAPIIVEGNHIANLLIGQSNVMGVGKERIETYAKEIGADTKKMLDAFETMSQMTLEKFEHVLNLLWLIAKEISTLGHNNLKLAKDITKRKQAEEALKESEEKLRNIFEHSTNAFYSHTPEHILTYMSPQVEEILGHKADETLKKWTEFASDNPVNKIGFELTKKAIKTGKSQPPYELEFIHKNGEKVWIEIHEGPVVVNGKTIAIVGAFTDITERKNAEQELKKYREHLEELVKERTKELEKKNKELERMNSLFVGREFRIKELKAKINNLEKKKE